MPSRFFVDANIVIYSAVAGPYHGPCNQILLAVAGASVEGQMSTAALEEVWHLEVSGKVGLVSGLTQRAYKIFAPLLPVTDEAFRRALALPPAPMGTNDRLHVGTCAAHGIGLICSADAAFDRAPGLQRVDPLDQQSLTALLQSPQP